MRAFRNKHNRFKIQLEVYKDIEKAVDKSIQRAGLINQYKNKAKSSSSNRIQNAQYVNKLKKYSGIMRM